MNSKENQDAPRERFKDKVVIVTGAASGIGKASVERFLVEGATVVAFDLAAVGLSELEFPDGRGHAVGLDVTDVEAVRDAVAGTVDRYGRLDVYFNNAGVPQSATPTEEMSLEAWSRILNVNLTAAFIAAREVLPQMRAQKSGCFLVTSSTSGVRQRPDQQAYNASKAGVIAFVRSIAIEAAADNVRANVICPTTTDTPLLGQVGYGTSEEAIEYLLPSTPLGRVADPSEIASVAAFLASEEASFVTGAAVLADGGRVL